MTEWMDLHAHLNMLEEGPVEALRIAREAGVVKVATIGTEPKDLPLVLELAEKNYPDVFCTLGIHPHEGQIYTPEIGAFIEANVAFALWRSDINHSMAGVIRTLLDELGPDARRATG